MADEAPRHKVPVVILGLDESADETRHFRFSDIGGVSHLLVKIDDGPSNESSQYHEAVTSTSNQELIAAPSGANEIVVRKLTIFNSSNTAGKVIVRNATSGTTGSDVFVAYLAARGGGVVAEFPGLWPLGDNNALNAQVDTGVTAEVNVDYYERAV